MNLTLLIELLQINEAVMLREAKEDVPAEPTEAPEAKAKKEPEVEPKEDDDNVDQAGVPAAEATKLAARKFSRYKALSVDEKDYRNLPKALEVVGSEEHSVIELMYRDDSDSEFAVVGAQATGDDHFTVLDFATKKAMKDMKLAGVGPQDDDNGAIKFKAGEKAIKAVGFKPFYRVRKA